MSAQRRCTVYQPNTRLYSRMAAKMAARTTFDHISIGLSQKTGRMMDSRKNSRVKPISPLNTS